MAEGDSEFSVGAGPVAPSVHVVAADAAVKVIALFQHEGCLGEMGHINSPRSEATWNDGQVGVDTIRASTLHLGFVEGTTRDRRFPRHLLLGAEGPVRRDLDCLHLLWDGVAVSGTLLAADLGLEGRARLGTAVWFVESLQLSRGGKYLRTVELRRGSDRLTSVVSILI